MDAVTASCAADTPRPVAHDLLKHIIYLLDAEVTRVLINDLASDTFYARIILRSEGEELEVDSRPSDAIALAVRCSAPIWVAEHVMDRAAIVPEADARGETEGNFAADADEDMDAFRDFVEGLNLEGLGGSF